jgi:hypothetical protein
VAALAEVTPAPARINEALGAVCCCETPNPPKYRVATTKTATHILQLTIQRYYTTTLRLLNFQTRLFTSTTSCLHESKSNSRQPARPSRPTKTCKSWLHHLPWYQQRLAKSRHIHLNGVPRSEAYWALRKHRSRHSWTTYNWRVRFRKETRKYCKRA